MRYITAGESHGKALVGVLEGLPAGLKIDFDFINAELKRRQGGYGRGGRMLIESDVAEIITGVRGGLSLASPLTLLIFNKDFSAWEGITGAHADKLNERVVTRVRPGHADLSGAVKYGFDDARNVLERSSARETATKVALGAIAKLYLRELGITVGSHTLSIGEAASHAHAETADGLNEKTAKNDLRVLDENAYEPMKKIIDSARAKGDTVGGVTEVIISHVKSGVGSYVGVGTKLDSILAREIEGIQAVKTVEFGDGVRNASVLGSCAHDKIYTDGKDFFRKANHAGGIEGGMSNGENIVIKAYVKPIPTLMSGLETVDLNTRESATAATERSDVCVVPAAGVVCEAAAALALMSALSDMLGGDTMAEVKQRYASKKSAVRG